MKIISANHIKLRKKYRNLNRQETLFDQLHGPKTISTNFVFDNWTFALSGFFTKHGNKRFSETFIESMLQNTFWEIQRQKRTCWVITLGENHLRPEFLYSSLRARFPSRSIEDEKKWISSLKNKLLQNQKTKMPTKSDEIKQSSVMYQPKNGLIIAKSSLRELSIDLAHHYQVMLNWENPGRLLISPNFVNIFSKILNSEAKISQQKNYHSSKTSGVKELKPLKKNEFKKQNYFVQHTKKNMMFWLYSGVAKRDSHPVMSNKKTFIKNGYNIKKINKIWIHKFYQINQKYKNTFWSFFENYSKPSSSFKISNKGSEKEKKLNNPQKKMFLNLDSDSKEGSEIRINVKRWNTKILREPKRFSFYYDYKMDKTPFWKSFFKWKQAFSLQKTKTEVAKSLNKEMLNYNFYTSQKKLYLMHFFKKWLDKFIKFNHFSNKNQRQLLVSEKIKISRRIKNAPVVYYKILELNLIDFEEMEEHEIHGPGKRFLIIERKYGKVGYKNIMQDIFSLVTPTVKLMARVIGHKSSRRTVYQVRTGVSLKERRRIIFGWLRNFINKNNEYNYLRRNLIKKPASKKIRTKPEQSQRLTTSFYQRLGCELKRVLMADEPIIKNLNDFDKKIGFIKPTRRHYRWD